MKTHYCEAEKTTIEFEGECNWCGEKDMTKDEALLMAIEAMSIPKHMLKPFQDEFKDAIKACKDALAQPAQEPVAWMDINGHVVSNKYKEKGNQFSMQDEPFSTYLIPLFTHPAPSWQGLSHDEIDKEALKDDHAAYFALGALWANQALKEKNT